MIDPMRRAPKRGTTHNWSKNHAQECLLGKDRFGHHHGDAFVAVHQFGDVHVAATLFHFEYFVHVVPGFKLRGILKLYFPTKVLIPFRMFFICPDRQHRERVDGLECGLEERAAQGADSTWP
jgi:hypothetical protein